MIFVDVVNVGMVKGVNKPTSKTPVKVVSSDIRTLRDGNRKKGLMVRVVGHTLGRRDSVSRA